MGELQLETMSGEQIVRGHPDSGLYIGKEKAEVRAAKRGSARAKLAVSQAALSPQARAVRIAVRISARHRPPRRTMDRVHGGGRTKFGNFKRL